MVNPRRTWGFYKEKEEEEELIATSVPEIIQPKPMDSSQANDMVASSMPEYGTSHVSTTLSTKPFDTIQGRMAYYEEKIVWLEGIAEEKGGLGSSGYDAYRYAIEQYNKSVDEHNSSIKDIPDAPSMPKRQPQPMQRIGVSQRQRGIGEVPETELDLKDMPASVKLIDDALQGAMKGVPLGVAGFAESFAQLLVERGEILELQADPEKFVGDPKWKGVDEKFFTAMYGGDQFGRGKVGAFASEAGTKIVHNVQKWSEQFLPAKEASEVEKFTADLLAGGVSLVGAIGTAVITKSPAAAATVFGLAARGSTYGKARKADVPVLKASALGGIHQTTETITEFIGLEFILSKLPVGRALNIILKGTGEGAQEYTQGWFGNLVEKYGWNKAKDVNEGLKREATIGFLLGGGASVVIDNISQEYGIDPNDITRETEATYQQVRKLTNNIDYQTIEDGTQDYSMDVDVTSPEKLDDYLNQSTEEILDSIDDREFESMAQYEDQPIDYLEEKKVTPAIPTELEGLAREATSKEDLIEKIYGHYLEKERASLEDEDVSEGRGEVEEVADLAKDQAVEKIIKKFGSLDNFIKKVEPLAPDTVSGEAKEATFAEGKETDLTVTDVGTPAIDKVPPLPPSPPLKERKEWEPSHLPAVKKDVPDTLKFKEPTITKWYTPKLELMRQLGFRKVLGNLPEAKLLEDQRLADLTHGINELINKINKSVPVSERFKAWLTNKPTEKVAALRNLLNAYEKAPSYLTIEEKLLFNEVRDFTTNLLNITNEFRKQVGLPEINRLDAYIPHFLDEIAKAAANGMYPYVADVYRWTGKKPPKRNSNPTARQRTVDKLTDDLNEVFSKDLGKLLKAMAKYDLRDIYLAIPYAQVRANIDALKGQIPADSLKELEEYLEYDIFDHQTELDRSLNNFIRNTGFTSLVNFGLKPFGRVMTNPIQLFSAGYRQLLMTGAIAGKPRIIIRNIFQRLLTLDFVAPIDFAKAQFYAPTWQMEVIRDTAFYKQSVKTFEDIPTLLRPAQWGMYPFQKSHAGFTYLSNIDVAMRAGWWSGQRKIDWCQSIKGQQEIREYIAKRPDLTEQEKEDLVWREGDQIMEAVEVGSYTQWMYFSSEMPRVFRGSGARAFWSLQSWTMNYFGKHVPEMSRRTFKGVTGTGRIVPHAERWRAAKGLGILLAVLGALKKVTGVDMIKFAFFPFPTIAAPHLGQIIGHTYGYLTALVRGEDAQSSLDKLQSNLKLLIPFQGAVKRYLQMIKGDITVKEWLFYMENNNNWKQIWIKDKPKKDVQSGVNYGEQLIVGDEEIIAGYGSEPIAGDEDIIAGY